jgi:enterochelin esterase-like enzyme
MPYGVRTSAVARRLRRVTEIGGVLAVLFLLASAGNVAASGAGVLPAGATQSITCASPALGGRLPARVYLPPGYPAPGRRYPVIYFLHGLPAGPSAYRGFDYLAHALTATRRAAVLVIPQAAPRPNSDREYLDWSSTEDWPRAISHDLTRCIDSRYYAIRDRRGRALMGVSAGGFGALNIGLRHLDTFAAVESWSGYFAATDPSGDHVLKLGSARADRDARVPRGAHLQHALLRWPSLIAFYLGRQDPQFLTANERYDRALSASGIPHVFHTYPGGHTHSLWAREAPAWMTLALTFLSNTAATEGPVIRGSASVFSADARGRTEPA